MGKVYFLFGVHNHQPVGNFHHIFDDAANRCYMPFVDILYRYPELKCSLHTSGPLYDWMAKHRPDYGKLIKEMAKRGQIEIVSGGYYEPILPIIPDDDKLGQIALMNDFIKKQFSQDAKGTWIAERIWEPYLARIINSAGLTYTFVDDTHFRFAGLREKEFFGYYTTEDAGRSIYIFPISKTLRYKIPFSQAHEAVSLLKSFAQKTDVLVTLFDDGEKFGLWPDTYDWVYNKRWLANFFDLLMENSDIIQTVTAAEALSLFESNGLVYLPTGAYEEMGEWVLEAHNFHAYEDLKHFLKDAHKLEQFSDFIRGGFFRNFYKKYPRLNYMHKRMQHISRKIHAKRSAKAVKNKALKSLWMGQCNCGYWHGIFGGFYLGHIRAAIYENLIKAEKQLDDKKIAAPKAERTDVDFDASDETLIYNKHLACVFKDRGGALCELSFKDKDCNLLNTITRQEESYHAKIRQKATVLGSGVATIHERVKLKSADLNAHLIYDAYERLAFVDHLVDKNITIGTFNSQKGIRSLSRYPYEPNLKRKNSSIELRYIYEQDDIAFVKNLTLGKKAAIAAAYTFMNQSALKDFDFAVEFNLFLQSPEDVTFNSSNHQVCFEERCIVRAVNNLKIDDRYKKMDITFTFDEADVFIMPVFSVSSSESGFEKAYQQMSILLIKKSVADSFAISITMKGR